MFTEIVKTAFVPGSVGFLLFGLTAGVVLLFGGVRALRIGRAWLALLTTAYLALALPVVTDALVAGLEPDGPPVAAPADARGSRVAVVLGNGVVTYRAGEVSTHVMARWTTLSALEGARVYRALRPDWVIASGGIPNPSAQTRPEADVIRDALVVLGVPVDRILLEGASRNTSEQIGNVAALVRSRGIRGPLVVVTSPTHYRRVEYLAARHGLTIVESPADRFRDGAAPAAWHRWRPSVGSLRNSEMAIYEYLAIVKEWAAMSRPT